jgi:hypothetical protein
MAWWRKRRLLGPLLAAVLLATVTLPVEATVNTDVASDADWIMTARLADGSIANYVDRQAVWPYLSNFAAMGLARATTVTKNAAYVNASWSWLRWYQAHMNSQGFVTDYVMQNGVLTSTGDMDSTDSYAGTFLLAARETYRANASVSRLSGVATGVANAVKAIEATQDADGLTWAKPAWHVKYLMDQAEAYAGLLAAVDIATALKNSALATRASADATRMKNGVAALWNAGSAAYDWAKHDTGVTIATDWSILYSDALQQAWAVAFGLVDSVRSPALLAKFNLMQANWHLPLANAIFSGGGTAQVGYWPVAGFGFVAIKSPLASTAALDIRSGAMQANRAWPFTTGNAGQLILLESNYSLPLLGAASTSLLSPPTTTSPTSATKTTLTTTATATKSATTTTVKSTTTTAKPTTTTAPNPTTTTTAPLVALTPPGGSTITVPAP